MGFPIMNTIDIPTTPRSEWLEVALAVAHSSFDVTWNRYKAYEAAYGAADALTVQKSHEVAELFDIIMRLEIEKDKVFDQSVMESIVWD